MSGIAEGNPGRSVLKKVGDGAAIGGSASPRIGLGVMVFGSVLPVGILQLEVAFTQGYDAARSVAFYNGDLVQALFWARQPGETLIIVGTLLFGYDVVHKRFQLRDVTPEEERRPFDEGVLADD